MDLKEQERISQLLREQAEKLGIALKALHKIRSLEQISMKSRDLMIAINVAKESLCKISYYEEKYKGV